jgi:hypothetical protein
VSVHRADAFVGSRPSTGPEINSPIAVSITRAGRKLRPDEIDFLPILNLSVCPTFVGKRNSAPLIFNNDPTIVSVKQMLKSTTVVELQLPIGAFGGVNEPNVNAKIPPTGTTTPAN